MKEVYLAKINQAGDTIRCGFYHSFYRNGCPDQKGYIKKINSRGNGLFDQNGYLSRINL